MDKTGWFRISKKNRMWIKMTKENVISYLKMLKNTNVSSTDDEYRIEKCLKVLGFPNAIVTCGCCYLEGSGNPIDIHTVAGMLYDKFMGSL